MKVAVLYSGGKDSNYALFLASKEHTISCLVSMQSQNDESYMFQSAGNKWVTYQAEALDLPLIHYPTSGEKEKELDDLKAALMQAKKEYEIEGVVTGAIQSAYQSSRVQKICNELDLWCYNPLWQIDEEQFLEELIENKFRISIVGVFSYPLEEKHIGKLLDKDTVEEFKKYRDEFGLSIIGEGGELETFVLDSPLFKERLVICDQEIKYENNAGTMTIKEMESIIK